MLHCKPFCMTFCSPPRFCKCLQSHTAMQLQCSCCRSCPQLWLQVAALVFRTFQQHRSSTAHAAMTVNQHQPVSHVIHQVCIHSLQPHSRSKALPCFALPCLQMLPKLLWPTSCAWLQASWTLTETSAKQLLLQWQAVKANALGNYALSVGFTLKITF